MNMKNIALFSALAAVFCARAENQISETTEAPSQGVDFAESQSPFKFNAGADLRIRQEIMHNVATLPYGVLGRPGVYRGKTKNQLRFRPDVWMELKAGDNWRFYTRITDEFRYGVVQRTKNQEWPCEAVIDNLYLEGLGLFDDLVDFRIGRQDLYRMYGLNHIFVDGTPGDGSCTTYADIARMAFHVDEESWLDLFALWTHDQEELRLGSKRSRRISKTGYGRGEREMDDWGFGTIWNSKLDFIDYQLFWIQKNTAAYHRDGVKYARRQTNLIGTKLVPRWTNEFSTPIELMAQIGKNGDGDTLHAWATYVGTSWKQSEEAEKSWRPFWDTGVLILSGDKNAANEDGGHSAWDPMWYRGIDDSEMFLYGSLYGCAWWSNMINLKTQFGVDFGYRHKVQFSLSSMWAEEKDGLGGGDGYYKGFISQVRYDFPLWIADKSSGGRFELFGHVLAELFNPGDYYETDKPALFVRWQIDLKF